MLRSVVRVGGFIRKELVEILRQPRLVLLLVLGPFLVLLLFGIGYRDIPPELRTEIVIPDDSPLREQIEAYGETATRIELTEIGSDRDAALERLAAGDVQLVVEVPPVSRDTILADEQTDIVLYHDQIDPVEVVSLDLFARLSANDLNRRILQALVEEGQREAADVSARIPELEAATATLLDALARGDTAAASADASALAAELRLISAGAGASALVLGQLAAEETEPAAAEVLERLRSASETVAAIAGGASDPAAVEQLQTVQADLDTLEEALADLQAADPAVLVSPFDAEAESIVGEIDVTDYYGPAVIALLGQHLAVTFGALSIVRESELGTTELFRVSPVSASEILFGKYVAYLFLGGFVAAALTALLYFGLDVPMDGDWATYAGVVALVLVAALGLGFVISASAGTDSQAVQAAMLTLLAGIFFSGFLLNLERIWEPVRALSWLLPVSYGIRLLQDVMLRGQPADPVYVVALGVLAVALFGLALALLRRRLVRI